ncbi:hypothetical protein AMR74_15555 [Halorubrum tropicale]|uniref:Uncharacterized protein n=1 Tax=Halorubrum tropicale TaxID=1765655 RepID=A0A0M9AN02_9EURY|nr:hypothetical protein AMR74_15555 [Halorubrum tropicale]
MVNTRDAIPLVPNVFDFDGALFTLFNRWRLCRLLGLWVSVSIVLVDRGCRQHGHTVRLISLQPPKTDLLLRYFNYI